MAQLVKHENNLLALEVSLGVAGSSMQGEPAEPVVAFEVQRGDELLYRTTATPEELGVPEDLAGERWTYTDPRFSLPDDLLDSLEAAITPALTDRDRLLWLNIAIPAGFVALLPWESMLRRRFSRPVVRVPNFALHPPRDTDDLDVVICVSQPEAKLAFDAVEHTSRVIDALRLRVPFNANLHVFADAATQDRLREHWPEHSLEHGSVTIHDPGHAPPPTPGGPRFDDPGEVVNPWLHWIAEEMAGTTVESVHFIAHSYLARNQAALALAESPTFNVDSHWARFIGPRQVATFLGKVGAWAVGLSSPSQDYSPMGSRLFVNDLSRERAGPILHHPFATDPTGLELGEAYFSIFTGTPPAAASDVAMYCHPRLFPDTSPGDSLSYAESLVGAALGSLSVSDSAQPAWATLTRRRLEQSTALLFPDTEQPGSAEQATGEGVREALEFVSQLIEMAASSGATDRAAARTAPDEASREAGA